MIDNLIREIERARREWGVWRGIEGGWREAFAARMRLEALLEEQAEREAKR